MRLESAWAASAMDGALTGPGGVATGVSIDTRTLAPGDLFFAIRGSRLDGHAFVAAAFAAGAAGAVVEHRASPPSADPTGRVSGFCIRVNDTTRALGALARRRRLESRARIVAITGSVGKTTTKEAAAAALGTAFSVFRSAGNLNNQWGLPLSLLAADGEAVGVVELGMSAPGEIRRLTRIAVPDCGVLTAVAEAHLEFFGSLEAIAAAKGELFEALSPDATAVVNADDERVRRQGERFSGRRVSYGFRREADVRGSELRRTDAGLRFRARAFAGPAVPVRCRLEGRHNASNVLAGLAAAVVLGVPLEQAAGGVEDLAPLPGRGQRTRLASGAWAVDETYNSSPRALLAVLREFAEQPAGRRILVVGDMLELGAAARSLHRECGRAAAAAGLDRIVGVGPLGGLLAKTAAELGAKAETAAGPEEAAALLAPELRPDDLVLFKASRGVGLEAALTGLGRAAAPGAGDTT